jgi:hypothetical protein
MTPVTTTSDEMIAMLEAQLGQHQLKAQEHLDEARRIEGALRVFAGIKQGNYRDIAVVGPAPVPAEA